MFMFLKIFILFEITFAEKLVILELQFKRYNEEKVAAQWKSDFESFR